MYEYSYMVSQWYVIYANTYSVYEQVANEDCRQDLALIVKPQWLHVGLDQ